MYFLHNTTTVSFKELTAGFDWLRILHHHLRLGNLSAYRDPVNHMYLANVCSIKHILMKRLGAGKGGNSHRLIYSADQSNI